MIWNSEDNFASEIMHDTYYGYGSPRYRSARQDNFHKNGNYYDDTGSQIFRKQVLSWKVAEIFKPQNQHLSPLPNFLAYYDIDTYYRNFLPLILEETRAILVQGLDLESREVTKPFSVKVISLNNKRPDIPANLDLEGILPNDTEEGTACIALKLTYGSGKQSTSLLCLADLRDRGKIAAKIDFHNPFIYNFIDNNPTAFNKNSIWTACVLGSVLSQMRMYEACSNPVKPNFIGDIVTGRLSQFIQKNSAYLPEFTILQQKSIKTLTTFPPEIRQTVDNFAFLLDPSTQQLFPVFYLLTNEERTMVDAFLALSHLEQTFIYSFCLLDAADQETIKMFNGIDISSQKAIKNFASLNESAQQLFPIFLLLIPKERELIRNFLSLTQKEQFFIYTFYGLKDSEQQRVKMFGTVDYSRQEIIRSFFSYNFLMQNAIKYFHDSSLENKTAIQLFFTLDSLEQITIQKILSLTDFEIDSIKSFYDLTNAEQKGVKEFQILSNSLQEVLEKSSSILPSIWKLVTGKSWYEEKTSQLQQQLDELKKSFSIRQKYTIIVFQKLNTQQLNSIQIYLSTDCPHYNIILKFLALDTLQKIAIRELYNLGIEEQNAIKSFYLLNSSLQTNIVDFYALNSSTQNAIKLFYELTANEQMVILPFSALEYSKQNTIKYFCVPDSTIQYASKIFDKFTASEQKDVKSFSTLVNPKVKSLIKSLYELDIDGQQIVQPFLDQKIQKNTKRFFVLDPSAQKAISMFTTFTVTEQTGINFFSSLDDSSQQAVKYFFSLKLPEQNNLVEFFELNYSQQTAVRNFYEFERGIQLLQGPPGTGKTTMIVELLNIFASQNRRVLVCAPSNKAVQVIAERFLAKYPIHRSILIGVENKLKDSLRPIFIHTWADDICASIDTVIEKIKTHARRQTQKMQKQILQEIQQIIDTIDHSTSIFTDSLNILKQMIKYADENQMQVFVKQLDILKSKICASLKYEQKQGGSELELELLNYAQVIFATLSTSGRHIFSNIKKPEILIVDEASQAVEAETLIPLALQPTKCLLVGDTKQLPATVISPEAVKYNYNWSMMWRLIEECKQDSGLLTVQYRMHSEIRKWPSEQYYNNKLEDAPEIANRPASVSQYGPYAFINVDSIENVINYSYYNTRECSEIITLLAKLNASGVDIKKQVGIITFYAAQVNYMQREFNKIPWLKDVKAHTVDSYQGSECDYIIISFVRSNRGGGIGFLHDFRRLNVGITRARLCLLMIGNATTLERHASDIATLVKDARTRNCLFEAKQSVVYDMTEMKSSIQEIEQKQPVKATFFYNQQKGKPSRSSNRKENNNTSTHSAAPRYNPKKQTKYKESSNQNIGFLKK
jgi:superfamily I DNA and/or RNA helicase